MPISLDRLASLKVADVMTRQVVALSPHQTMAEAAALFVQHKISGAPVIDEQGRCVGVLSSADFVGREHEEAQVSSTLSACDQGVVREAARPWQIEDVFQDRVAAHLSPAVQTVDAQMPLVEAGRVLCAQHIHRLPVLDEQGSPVGMVTSLDIVAAFVQAVEEAKSDTRHFRGN